MYLMTNAWPFANIYSFNEIAYFDRKIFGQVSGHERNDIYIQIVGLEQNNGETQSGSRYSRAAV